MASLSVSSAALKRTLRSGLCRRNRGRRLSGTEKTNCLCGTSYSFSCMERDILSLYFFPHDGQNLDLHVKGTMSKLLHFVHSTKRYPSSMSPQLMAFSTLSTTPGLSSLSAYFVLNGIQATSKMSMMRIWPLSFRAHLLLLSFLIALILTSGPAFLAM